MIASPFQNVNPYKNGASRLGEGRNGKAEFSKQIQQLTNEGGGPESGMAIPHVISLQAVIGTAYNTYWHGNYDEALRDSQANADAMRNDPFLMRLIQENKDAVCSLKWSVEVDNERDPWQKCIKDSLTQQWRAIPYAEDLNQYMLEAMWYGRYGGQFSWVKRKMDLPALPKGGGLAGSPFLHGGPMVDAGHPATGPMGSLMGMAKPGATDREKRLALCIKWHMPYEGDKIGYDYDGCPYVLVQAQAAARYKAQGAEIGNSPKINAQSFEYGYTTAGGKALFLRDPSWRERFAIHRGMILDSPFLDAEKGDQIHGLGIRSVIYWYWWLRDEFLSNVSDWCARTGLGVRLWYYDASNPASEAAVDRAARDQSDKVNIKIPRTPGAQSQEGVEFVDTTGSGADLLLRIVQYLDEQIMLYVVGQSMSSGSDTQDGLGGTGRANFAASTKYQITRRNAAKYSDTCTYDILDTMKRHSFPKDLWEIPARLVYHADSPNPKEFMEAVKTFVDLGGTVREDTARAVIGFDAPHEGDRVLGGQQPLPPGVGGGGIGEKKDIGGKNDAPNDHNGEGQKQAGSGIFQQDGEVKPDPMREAADAAQRFQQEGEKDRYSRWITLGGTEVGDEKHHGGFHVEIDKDGKILRGGSTAMHGKTIHDAVDALHKFSEEDKGAKEKSAHSAPAKPPEYPASVMKAHAESLKEKSPEPKEVEAPPKAEPQELEAKAEPKEVAPAKKQPARSSEEARHLFDALPKSGVSGLPKIAEQIASKFAQGDRDKWDELRSVATDKIFDLALHHPDIKPETFEGLANTAATNAVREHFSQEQAQKRGGGKVKQFGEDFNSGEIEQTVGLGNAEGGAASEAVSRPEEIAMQNEKAAGIRATIASLPESERKIAETFLQMAEQPGKAPTIQELADQIAGQTGANKSKVYRVIKGLHAELARFNDPDKYSKELLDKLRYMLEPDLPDLKAEAEIARLRYEAAQERDRLEREREAAEQERVRIEQAAVEEKIRMEKQDREQRDADLTRERQERAEEKQRFEATLLAIKPEAPAFDMAALLTAIREMPPPIINVTIPEQPQAPPIDLAELGKIISERPVVVQMPEQKARTVKITKGKDGQYTAKVE